jgi:hypothetical protein
MGAGGREKYSNYTQLLGPDILLYRTFAPFAKWSDSQERMQSQYSQTPRQRLAAFLRVAAGLGKLFLRRRKFALCEDGVGGGERAGERERREDGMTEFVVQAERAVE